MYFQWHKTELCYMQTVYTSCNETGVAVVWHSAVLAGIGASADQIRSLFHAGAVCLFLLTFPYCITAYANHFINE